MARRPLHVVFGLEPVMRRRGGEGGGVRYASPPSIAKLSHEGGRLVGWRQVGIGPTCDDRLRLVNILETDCGELATCRIVVAGTEAVPEDIPLCGVRTHPGAGHQ